jgi:hypothetical protein
MRRGHPQSIFASGLSPLGDRLRAYHRWVSSNRISRTCSPSSISNVPAAWSSKTGRSPASICKADRSRRYINQLDEWFRPLVIWRECAAPCTAAKLVVGRGMPGHLVTRRAETSQIFGRINSCDGLMPVAPVYSLEREVDSFQPRANSGFGVRRGCQRRREAIVKSSREWRT